MTDADFAAYEATHGQFLMLMLIGSKLHNAGDEQYKGFYVDDTNFFAFGSQLGVSSFLYVSEDTIETD